MKSLIALLVLLFVTVIMFNQIGRVNAAESVAPLTSPISVTTKKISGRITFRFFGDLAKQYKGQTIGVEGVQVWAVEKKTFEAYVAFTDKDGNYTLNVPAGSYTIRAHYAENLKITPNVKFIKVSKKDVLRADFKIYKK